jgi:hypothetical protein
LGQVINGADIVRFTKVQRVKWLGHIQRMDTSRIAKKNIRMETNRKAITGKTEIEMAGRCV